jgi:hypothetical protein
MENPAHWNQLCAALAVAPLDAGAESVWAWLTHLKVVPDTPNAFEHFAAAYREVVDQLESPHGWATGPSPAAVFAALLAQHGVITDEGHRPDPHAAAAKMAFGAWRGEPT